MGGLPTITEHDELDSIAPQRLPGSIQPDAVLHAVRAEWRVDAMFITLAVTSLGEDEDRTRRLAIHP